LRLRTSRSAALAFLLAVAVPALPGTARAQDELPEQLRVIADVKFKGMKHLGGGHWWLPFGGINVPKTANLHTRRPSRFPWRAKPPLRLDYLRADTAAIATLYHHYGYLDASAMWTIESTRDPNAARVIFHVHEGPRSKVSTVTLTGLHAFPEKDLRKNLQSQPGRWFDPAFLPLDTLHISSLYQERGYLPHTLASAARGRPDSLKVAVGYAVREGLRYQIGRIDFENSGKSRPALARRELAIHPGEIYRRSRIELSVQRLYETGLYSQVQMSAEHDSTTPDKIDLAVRLAERRPRWVDLGIGSGTAELFRLTAAWGHRNIDTRGLLFSVSGEAAVDRQRRDIQTDTRILRPQQRANVSLIEPWLLGLRLQGQATGFYENISDDRDIRFLQFRDSRGVEFGLLREFSRLFRTSATAHFALVHQSYLVFVGGTDTLPPATRDSLARVLPRYGDNGISLSLIRDSRDDRITPLLGSLQTLTGEVGGGPLRGQSRYDKLQFVSSWYSPRPNGWQLAVRLSGGAMAPIGNPPPDFQPGAGDPEVARVPRERLFAIGGVNSLRGYSENSIPAGGGMGLLLGNFELRMPLRGPFGAELFFDAGNVWSQARFVRSRDFVSPFLPLHHGDPGEVRYSYGLGARLLLPFGPLRLDMAWSNRDDFPRSSWPDRTPLPFAYQFAIGPSF